MTGGKQIGGEFIKDGTGVAVKDGVINTISTSTFSGSSFLSGLGVGLVGQAVLSVVSAYASSGWIKSPAKFYNGYANDGIKPSQLNKEDQKNPIKLSVISDLEVKILMSCFNDYKKNFIKIIGNEAELWLSE